MHRTATRDQWRAEREALLAREKELTRLGDAVAAARRELPWVAIEKAYAFDTPEGPRTLAELFQGRSQLLVYHFMMGPGTDSVCASCSSIADGVNGPHVHLEHHDVAFTAVSRAPLAEIEDSFDLVVANILASELVALAADLRRVTAADGTLIVSGVLAGGYDHVLAALSPMELVRVDLLDGLAALVLRHQ